MKTIWIPWPLIILLGVLALALFGGYGCSTTEVYDALFPDKQQEYRDHPYSHTCHCDVCGSDWINPLRGTESWRFQKEQPK